MSNRILYTEKQIARRVHEIAEQISADYAEQDIILAGVLTGAFVFMADLARAIERIGKVARCIVGFMQFTTYGTGREAGGPRIELDLPQGVCVGGKNVVVVEDVADSLSTLYSLVQFVRSKGPSSLRVCVLLSKRAKHRPDIDLTLCYVGFEVEGDPFLIGYGLDDKYAKRGLPHIEVAPPPAND